MANQTTTTTMSSLEAGVMDAIDTLTGCPVCGMGTFALALYSENGRVKVECGTCGSTRDFNDAHTPPA